jgi:hypothetical protein
VSTFGWCTLYPSSDYFRTQERATPAFDKHVRQKNKEQDIENSHSLFEITYFSFCEKKKPYQ